MGQLTLAYRDNGGNLQAIKDGIIPAGLRAGGSGTSGAALPNDVTVNGSAPTFGDKTVIVFAAAGKLINSIPPDAREAASFGTSVLLGGPVAAVGGFFIGKAIEKGIESSPEAQKNIGVLVEEVGLRGVSSLSSATLDRNRSEAQTAEAEGRPGAFAESSNLLTAAGTLLSIGTVRKLLSKAGDVIPGGGINPGGGKVDVPDAPKVDLPNGPASSAVNAERLREQLRSADSFVQRLQAAPGELADIKAKIPGLDLKNPGTAAIAHVEIEGLPNVRTLEAHSQVNTDAFGLVGESSGNFTSSLQPNKFGVSTPRNIDAEYKILDRLADQIGSNRNARGTVDLFVDSRPCDSCKSVISQFQQRYPGITINIRQVTRPAATRPPTVPTMTRPKG